MVFSYNSVKHKLIIKINRNNTAAVAINASLCNPEAYAISIAILAVIVRTPLVIP